MAPFVLFSLMFALTHFWKTGDLSAQQLKIGLQVCTFLFIFVSATLYGVYINSVIGSALNVRTQMSLTRSYLFSLPIARATLFKLNQIRLLLPLMPYVVLGTFFIITFNFKFLFAIFI